VSAKEVSWQTWALGLFASVTLAGAGIAWADINARVEAIDRSGGMTAHAADRERIAVVEIRTNKLEEQYRIDVAEIKARIQRIEEKQDALLRELRGR
jgi:hypothetical protein